MRRRIFAFLPRWSRRCRNSRDRRRFSRRRPSRRLILREDHVARKLIAVTEESAIQQNQWPNDPQYKENVIPGKFLPGSLRLPEDKIRDFILSGDSIYNYERDKYFSEEKVKVLKNQATNSGFVIHKIRSGESLSTIAHRYRVTIAELKRWNGLKSNNIVAGKTLKIYPR